VHAGRLDNVFRKVPEVTCLERAAGVMYRERLSGVMCSETEPGEICSEWAPGMISLEKAPDVIGSDKVPGAMYRERTFYTLEEGSRKCIFWYRLHKYEQEARDGNL